MNVSNTDRIIVLITKNNLQICINNWFCFFRLPFAPMSKLNEWKGICNFLKKNTSVEVYFVQAEIGIGYRLAVMFSNGLPCNLPFPSCLAPKDSGSDELLPTSMGNREPVILNVYDMVCMHIFRSNQIKRINSHQIQVALHFPCSSAILRFEFCIPRNTNVSVFLNWTRQIKYKIRTHALKIA